MRSSLIVLAAAAAALAAPAGAAVQVGDTLKLDYLFPSDSSIDHTDSFVYTGGTQTFSVYYNYFNVIVSATGVTYDFSASDCAGCQWTTAQQNGPRITDLTTGTAFAGWTLLANNMDGPVSSTFAADAIKTNWNGRTLAGSLSYGAGAVPEPGAWAMLVLGFGLAGAAMRRSRAKSAKLAMAF